ncbi:hypothetical protein WMY93_028380 [Mugilogobius chulae]|uniref:G-protein coupled receptors family 1 profile domain-containing protein n=1 Tax=Mugilogobius chulae TaxID=88201 RepID=A0AAW0MZY6_9GOBI
MYKAKKQGAYEAVVGGRLRRSGAACVGSAPNASISSAAHVQPISSCISIHRSFTSSSRSCHILAIKTPPIQSLPSGQLIASGRPSGASSAAPVAASSAASFSAPCFLLTVLSSQRSCRILANQASPIESLSLLSHQPYAQGPLDGGKSREGSPHEGLRGRVLLMEFVFSEMPNSSDSMVLLLEGLVEGTSLSIFLFLLLVYLFIIFSNVSIFGLILFKRSLHQPVYLLYLNLSANDLLGNTTVFPWLLVDQLRPASLRHIHLYSCVVQV